MNKNKKSWQGKYNTLKDRINKDIEIGLAVKECPICNYSAVELEEYDDPICESTCLVCGQKGIWLEVVCGSCGETEFVSDSYTTCECGKTDFEKDELRKQLEVERSLSALADGGEYGDIYCTECFMSESTVIELRNGSYFCLECFESFDETSECDWCNTRYAGDIGEDTHFKGCENCEGYIGWHMDKDD